MSLTSRDGRCLKTSPTDTTSTDPRQDGAETMNEETTPAAIDVVATLCRMSLVRNESLSVNGAYVRTPPELA